jgi:hypothetical protein
VGFNGSFSLLFGYRPPLPGTSAFWSTVDLKDPELAAHLADWQQYYNWHRPHGSLNGKSPMERYDEVSKQAPLWEDVEKGFERGKERFREANYHLDRALEKLKRCP